MKKQTRLELLIALGALLSLPASLTGLADEPTVDTDVSDWACAMCSGTEGWFGEWDLGAIIVSDPALKFGDYRGLEEDDTYLDSGGNASFRGENGFYLDISGRNLGLDSRALELRGGNQGRFEFRANYSEIPHYLGHGTVTPYLGVGTGTLELPSSLAFSDGTLVGLEQALKSAPLDSKREIAGAGLTFRLASKWKYSVDFERQKREGTRAFSGGLFVFGAAIFPAPLDHTTDQYDMGLEYTGNRGQFRLGFTASDFDNGYRAVTWDNPFAIGIGDEVSRSALEPDNEFYQASLAGAVRIFRRIRLSGKASFGEMKQDDPFLPYSINPAHDDLTLPRTSLAGKVDASMFNLSGRVHARLGRGFDLYAQYKTSERDNKTPIDIYTPVVLEVFNSRPRSNRPYGYDRSQGRLEMRFRPRAKHSLNFGVQRDSMERTFQSVRETEEDSYWAELRIHPLEVMDVRLKFDSLDRSATPYEQLAGDSAENPLMRKFHLAERNRDRVTLEFDLYPTKELGINLSYYTTDDKYDRSTLGLTGSEEESLSLDISIALAEQARFYAFVSSDAIDSSISGARAFDAVPWNAMTRDEIRTWGMGFSLDLNARTSCGFDYVNSESEGEILTDSGAGEAPFPVLRTELRNARFFVNYKVTDQWSLVLDAYKEEYGSSDWLMDGVGPQSISSVLTMGETSPDYDVSVIRLLANVRF